MVCSDKNSKTPEEDSLTGDYSRRQKLFFTAITKFALKNSLGDIERYYAGKIRQAPHVINFYEDAVRLIGLNDRQLEMQLRKMQKAAKNSSSPYAKPLPFVTVSPRKKTKGSRKKKCKPVTSSVKGHVPPATAIVPASSQTSQAGPMGSAPCLHVNIPIPEEDSSGEEGELEGEHSATDEDLENHHDTFHKSSSSKRRGHIYHENSDEIAVSILFSSSMPWWPN